MKQTEEIAIVKKCQAGQTDEFGVLYDAYIEKIYNFIYYKTYHKQTAEDLSSQVFVKALTKIDSLDTARKETSFKSWLFRIAQNEVIDHYRTRKQIVDISDIWDLSNDEDVEADTQNKQKLEEVRRYLGRLPSEQRDIIVLRVWNELSYEEIAEIMQKSEGSCKVMFHRAIQKLRSEISVTALVLMIFS